MKGTAQPCRANERAVPVLAGEITAPAWLSDAQRESWDRKVAVYDRRGQSVVGCEDSLAAYVTLECEIIQLRKASMPVPAALVNAHRVWANEFYDTPASQIQRAPKKQDNPFGRNGKRPA